VRRSATVCHCTESLKFVTLSPHGGSSGSGRIRFRAVVPKESQHAMRHVVAYSHTRVLRTQHCGSHRADAFRCLQVREALVTSALLQLPFSMPMREKLDRVEGIITELVSAGVPEPTLQFDTHMLGLPGCRALNVASHARASAACKSQSTATCERSASTPSGDSVPPVRRCRAPSTLRLAVGAGPGSVPAHADRRRDAGHEGHQRRRAAARWRWPPGERPALHPSARSLQRRAGPTGVSCRGLWAAR